jgi:hypothetical protein
MAKLVHNMFYDPARLDLEVIKKQALERSSDRRFTNNPPVVLIHFHRHGESCDNKQHIKYVEGRQEE